jgi:hypothetical protein
MAEEFTINSSVIESKINQLLPSQGGFAPGVDFSASTMVIPIVDLTETAEGSSLREDLQKSLSLTSITSFDVNNQTTTVINTTGYFRVFGNVICREGSASGYNDLIQLTDGTTTKNILSFREYGSATQLKNVIPFDFIVFLNAGDSLQMVSGNVLSFIRGCTRQVADISGTLVNPL